MKIYYDYVYTFVHKKNINTYKIKYEQENNLKGLIITLKNGTKLSTYFSLENQYFDPFISELTKAIK